MKRRNTIIAVLAIALIITGVWGYWQYRDKDRYYTFLDNQFQRMFYDLIGNVETISTDISKLLVSSQEKENIVLYSNILMNAYNAQDNLAQLPIRHSEVNKIEKFLNQVGDYTFALSRKSLNGDQLNKKDIANLEKLQGYAVELGKDLHNLHDKALKGHIWKGELRRKGTKKLNKEAKKESEIQVKLVKFQERMIEYPELIYDGPFSEHAIQGMKPRLEGKKINEEEAKKRAIEFVGKATVEKTAKSEENDSRISTYSFTLKPENKEGDKQNPIYIDISKTGGYPVLLLNNRKIDKANISGPQAVKIASKFLEEKGFKNMKPTFSLRADNVLLINYVYVQDNVIMYPDLIKIKVALDNGTIVGFDSTKYLTANYKRNIPKPKLTPEKAREKVSLRVETVEKPRLCYIPTPYLKEIFCYEFEVKYKGDTFFVYINAETGEEEKILKLIKRENGILMI
ncbi:germination protein YpeB [Paramaledivibacter caminithermalis]|jgi:germination protein YpeB|uniref:Germination protein YpeB n=1 Tax=Paramaledivibacter caminithermalis (strain DSM 15212 / CIP 107654 / DViRD3) TaxID=1121301 RepID=A0A1M6KGM9_PARC5|nr:germination protein YpeB [Paramaledivibacter caminithermalis]SHJ58104.1 germination protein YpeB [Paramaledivibacter caminithermalis DSM 15212]